MIVTLVAMPWQLFETPVMPLGVLASHLTRVRPHIKVDQIYGTTAWAQFVNHESRGLIGLEDYMSVANKGVYKGIGEWVFTSALYPGEEWPLDRFATFCEQNTIEDYPRLLDMWSLAPAFVEQFALHILAREPSVVGLSSTFSQNIASLAVARQLKLLRPALPVVMGGANCEGVMGPALLRNFPMLDYVCVGEGEETLVELIDVLEHHEETAILDGLENIAGLCWRNSDGTVVANPPRQSYFDINAEHAPNFTPFFQDLRERGISGRIRKRIPYEASRGCWWGAKKHCTFCGLNAMGMEFRSKSGDRVFADIEALVHEHQCLDIIFVDNIFDLKYFDTLIPKLAATDWDLRVFFEIKANLKEEQVATLAAARIAALQPGIESLSTDVLRLMRKGVDAAQNIIFLRAAEENSVTAEWNILYGFRDETPEQYERVIQQMPNLYHLQPPESTRVSLQRFSPNFDDMSLGFHIRMPSPMYRYLYNLPYKEVTDIAFFHQSEALGIGGETEARLTNAVEQWSNAYPLSSLDMYQEDGVLNVRDRRAHREPADHKFAVPWQVELISAARAGRGLQRLITDLQAAGFDVDAATVSTFVERLVALGLLFVDERDDGTTTRYVALPLTSRPLAGRAPAPVPVGTGMNA